MEPIPEDSELSPSAFRAVESRRTQREVFCSERIDTSLRFVPQSYVYEWELSEGAMDPNYYEDAMAVPESHSSAYAYSYERSFDPPPQNGGAPYDDDDADVERLSRETQKVTRVTKVTTTRSLKQVPAENDEYTLFEGHAALIQHDGYSASHVPAASYPYPNGSLRDGSVDGYGYVHYDGYGAPGRPGAPHVVEVDGGGVTLAWLRPDGGGDVDGYQVHYRRVDEPLWQPAHADLIADTQCTVSNLDPTVEHQFSVVAHNANGFGEPSDASMSVQLHADAPPAPSLDAGVPQPPGQPLVRTIDSTTVALSWGAPVTSGSGGPVAGYQVEYRSAGSADWLVSNDFLIPTCSAEVEGLRPNGEYEFRVSARNADGFSMPSRSSGAVRIRPVAPPRSPNSFDSAPVAAGLGSVPLPPSQPHVVDADTDSATLMWAPPPMPRSSDGSNSEPWRLLGYLIESREIGDPNWYAVNERPASSTQYTVRHLRPNSTFEFRVVAKSPGGLSQPSEASELVQLRPRVGGPARGVPARPQPPEVMEQSDDQVTLCWLPAHSALPVQGYDVEFRDLSHDSVWYKVNDLLMQSCKMTIGDLTVGDAYEFRVIAKNAMGYSEPSESSEIVTVGTAEPPTVNGVPVGGGRGEMQRELSALSEGPLALQDELDRARESPPLPDRDDSPPPIHRDALVGRDGVHWRDPTLNEVVDYLSSPNDVIRLNAAGYLQHLTFHDSEMKRRARELGAIPKLVDLLKASGDRPEIQKNACGCLRNLSYGRNMDENKRAIRRQDGIRCLAELLCKTPDMQVKEEITGALWNLSSTDELKKPVLVEAVEALVAQVIVPTSGFTPAMPSSSRQSSEYSPQVFRNATGVIRNVSAATETARDSLRKMPNLIESLIYYLRAAITSRQEYDTRPVENVVCVLRNLSYRLQEVDDPNYEQKAYQNGTRDRSKSAPSGSPNLKQKKESRLFKKKHKGVESPAGAASPTMHRLTKGEALLCHPSIVELYLPLLQFSCNRNTIEASAGAVQNLAACYWKPAVDVRAAVRTQKGLPSFVDLIRAESDDRCVCAATTALRNLALDQRNRDLIGKYAMKDLAMKLPVPGTERSRMVSDATMIATLGLLYETVRNSADIAKGLHEHHGTERLMYLSRPGSGYGARVSRYAAQVLFSAPTSACTRPLQVLAIMWSHRELQAVFRAAGYRETDFVQRSRGNAGDAATLARPISNQGAEQPLNARPRAHPDEAPTANTPRYGSINTAPSPAAYPMQHGSMSTNGNGRPQQHYDVPPTHPTSPRGDEPLYAQVQKRRPPPAGQSRPVADDSWV